MHSTNKVILTGHLTRDPEIRKTSGGTPVSELGVAINEQYKNPQGEEVERTCFTDVVVWGRMAERCEEFLSKGAPVLVEGALQQDRWETKTGEQRSRLRIRAQRVQFLGRPAASPEVSGRQESQPTSRRPAAAASF